MPVLYLGAAVLFGLGVLVLVVGLSQWLGSSSQLGDRLQSYSVQSDMPDLSRADAPLAAHEARHEVGARWRCRGGSRCR